MYRRGGGGVKMTTTLLLYIIYTPPHLYCTLLMYNRRARRERPALRGDAGFQLGLGHELGRCLELLLLPEQFYLRGQPS